MQVEAINFDSAIVEERVDAAIISAFNALATGKPETARAVLSHFAKASVHGRRFVETLAESEKLVWVELAKLLRVGDQR